MCSPAKLLCEGATAISTLVYCEVDGSCEKSPVSFVVSDIRRTELQCLPYHHTL